MMTQILIYINLELWNHLYGDPVAPDSDRSWLLKSDMVVCQLWEGRSLIQQLHQTSASCWGSERWWMSTWTPKPWAVGKNCSSPTSPLMYLLANRTKDAFSFRPWGPQMLQALYFLRMLLAVGNSSICCSVWTIGLRAPCGSPYLLWLVHLKGSSAPLQSWSAFCHTFSEWSWMNEWIWNMHGPTNVLVIIFVSTFLETSCNM